MKFFTWLRIQIETYFEFKREVQRKSQVCESCENLKMQLANQNQLINKLLEKPEIKEVHATQDRIPMTQPRIPWSVTRQKLEQESRLRANELLKQKNEEISELEKEVIEAKVGS